jgi:hypothetical protein
MSLISPVVLFILTVFLSVLSFAQAPQGAAGKSEGIYAGMPQEDFFRVFPRKQARTSREDTGGIWISYAQPLSGTAQGVITFHIKDGKVAGWAENDRREVVAEYMGEFCSAGTPGGGSKTYEAIRDVLELMPLKAFLNVTERSRPVLFTEYYDSGTAAFANSTELLSDPEDAPAFGEGLMIMKLSTALDSAESPSPIKGVVAHELAHHVLDHARQGAGTCAAEREANRLVKDWGFESEYEAASRMFGHEKVGGPASCHGP